MAVLHFGGRKIFNHKMEKPDYNIEFAHIYADEQFDTEQIKSGEILKEVITRLERKNKTFVVSVLIDEFHPVMFKLNEGEMVDELKKHGISVDFIGYESKLGVVADDLINFLPQSMLKLEHFSKSEKEALVLQNHNGKIGLKEEFEFTYRHTCALLSASWSMCRLGILKIPPDAVRNLSGKTFEAKNLITILPEKYRSVEDKVVGIVRSTKFNDVILNMKYEFFKI